LHRPGDLGWPQGRLTPVAVDQPNRRCDDYPDAGAGQQAEHRLAGAYAPSGPGEHRDDQQKAAGLGGFGLHAATMAEAALALQPFAW